MPRTARFAPGGVILHVLNRANAGVRIFEDHRDYEAFEQVMAETLEHIPVRVLTYCLMPNHWHMVLWPNEDGQMGTFMQRLTVTHVRRWHAHRHSAGTGHLYQGTYKSFPIQNDAHLLAACRYVERNPLRARLVERAECWRWSGLWWRVSHREEASLLTPWPVQRPPDYIEWVNQPQTAQELDEIRQCVTRGRPYGNHDWQRQTAGLLGLESTLRPRGRPRKRG